MFQPFSLSLSLPFSDPKVHARHAKSVDEEEKKNIKEEKRKKVGGPYYYALLGPLPPTVSSELILVTCRTLSLL